MSEKEYAREADKSTKEAMKECLAASENIMARSFGVEKVAAKARKLAASAKSAADEVSKWFDGKKMPQEDGRMALSVGDHEREFYERETGVLSNQPLPAAKPSPLDEDIQRLFEEKRQLDEWEAGTWEDTPTSEARQGAGVQHDAKCGDAWGDCPATQDVESRWTGAGERVGQGSRESARTDDADSRGDYTSALGSLLGERASGPDTDYRSALEAALEIEAERHAAKLRRELQEKSARERVARHREEKARQRARLEREAAAAWKKQLGSSAPSTTTFGGSGSALKAFQDTIIRFNQQQQAERQRYQQRYEPSWRSRPYSPSRRRGGNGKGGSIQ
ncbi:MAG: hypothetical protein OXE53_22980 [Deltaproteobacteria bacterium]|nr:hypothetical protein [Deltaproteobacteria bacterium]